MKTLNTALLAVMLTLSGLVTSCGEGQLNPNIAGIKGPTLTLDKDNLLINIIFENLILDGGIRYAIPKYKDSYLELGPDLESGGTLMAISVSLDNFFNNSLLQLDPQKLPGGRALPGVSSGAVPAVAFNIEQFHNMAFYLGKDIFGFFIPLKEFGMENGIVSFRYYLGGTRMGNISVIGSDSNGENAGLLLLLDMKSTVKSQLKKISEKY